MFSKERIDSIADEFDYDELNVHPNDRRRMCSYESREDSVKIHVYLMTGTVATCLTHPRSGKTQLFRRNNTLSDIKDIFENPRRHTGRGYFQNTGHIQSHTIAEKRLTSRCHNALRDGLRELDEETVHSISMGVNSFFSLYSDGTFDYYNISTHLHEKLQRIDFEEDIFPELVSLGSHHEDSYFIQFANGIQSHRHLPEDLERILENSDSKVDVIGFGGEEEHYYIRFLNGNVFHSLPERLENQLENEYRDLQVSRISFGNHRGGTSFAVKFSNGDQTVRMRGGTFSDDYDRASPEYVVVGSNGDYIMLC